MGNIDREKMAADKGCTVNEPGGDQSITCRETMENSVGVPQKMKTRAII